MFVVSAWLSSRKFFQGEEGKIYCYANFFCYANFLLFSDQISAGAKVSEGADCLRGAPPYPLWKKARVQRLQSFFVVGCKIYCALDASHSIHSHRVPTLFHMHFSKAFPRLFEVKFKIFQDINFGKNASIAFLIIYLFKKNTQL